MTLLTGVLVLVVVEIAVIALGAMLLIVCRGEFVAGVDDEL